MNVLTGIVLLALAAFALNGWIRGFIRVFAGMFFFLASVVLVSFATPYISGFLEDYTPIYQMVEESCSEALGAEGKKEDGGRGKDGAAGNLGLRRMLEQEMSGKHHEYAEEELQGYMSGYMASLILNLLTFVLTLGIVQLFLRMTVLTLDNLARLPVLHGANQFFGMLLGIVKGLFVIWIAFLMITVFANTDMGAKLMDMIHESPFLEYLYQGNLFLMYWLRMVIGKTVWPF